MQDWLMDDIRNLVLEHTGEALISLYVLGSYVTGDMTVHSDIDLVGIMKSDYDFSREADLNKLLNERIRPANKIDVGMMNHGAFFGEGPHGSILEHIDLPVFINFLKKARLVHGEKLDFDGFPVKPASPRQELEYYLGTFDECKDLFRDSDKIGQDFTFRDFVKTVFYIANIELVLVYGSEPGRSYSDTAHAFESDGDHIVHRSLKLRGQEPISRVEKMKWLESAEQYVRKMSRLLS